MLNSLQGAARIPAAVEWREGQLRLLDQTRLPAEEVYLDVTSVAVLEDAIRRLAVRGAPAIGCAAAFGVVLIARELAARPCDAQWRREFDARCAQLAAVRPTAVNLRWAVQRCRARAEQCADIKTVLAALEAEALAILQEDREMCAQIGRHGAKLLAGVARASLPVSTTGETPVPPRVTVMTHCNAGALATGGSGTALAVIYAAQEAGLSVKVFADETRPLLQGARLTAWELARAGVDVTVICDNMAAAVMREFKPQAVVVGADRIAANGDTANKIGTYGLAVLAQAHGVPFYVAAPSSTFDFMLRDGGQIPIEQRARAEISEQGGKMTVPPEAQVYNPAFDVTPAALIAGFITEKGVLKPPFAELKA